MIELIQSRQAEIVDICRRQGIRRLDVFGSAATGLFDPQTSDVDFIAEFDDQCPAGGLLDRYLDLATRLEESLGIAVDIITPRSIRNPYFRESVNSSRENVYAAGNGEEKQDVSALSRWERAGVRVGEAIRC